MDLEAYVKSAKVSIIAFGALALGLALWTMRTTALDPTFFLVFLMYGGPAAIVAAACESLAGCWYLKSKGYAFDDMMLPTNVSINVVSISLTYIAWLCVPPLYASAPAGSTQHLLFTLGSL